MTSTHSTEGGVMRLVAYLRVSTDRQAEDGLGLAVQEQAIQSWAKTNGHQIAAWCRDEGVSGSNGIDGREGLHDALATIKDGLAEGFVVYRLDRLARALTVQETTLAVLWGMGASVWCVDGGLVEQDTADDPMKTALRQMIGVFAQLERGMITARLRAGRRLAAEQGHYAGYGSPPLGHRVERVGARAVLVPDADEQATVARATELRAAGHTLRDICTILDAEGRAPKKGGVWHLTALVRVLRRAQDTATMGTTG